MLTALLLWALVVAAVGALVARPNFVDRLWRAGSEPAVVSERSPTPAARPATVTAVDDGAPEQPASAADPVAVPAPTAGGPVASATPDAAGGTPAAASTPAEPAEVAASEAPAGWIAHVVEQGDTVGRLAARYGTSMQSIIELNELGDPDALSLGQVLFIQSGASGAEGPVAASGAPGAADGPRVVTHVVAVGDTLGLLARRYETTPEAIAALNALSDPDLLVYGRELRVPVGVAPAPTAGSRSD